MSIPRMKQPMRPAMVWMVLLASASPLPAAHRWKLVWSDEFAGKEQSRPDPSRWTYDLGAGGWGNQEQERYTDSLSNAHLDGKGRLVISAQRLSAPEITSARLKTKGKFEIAYGRIEGRIRLPSGHGVWPAFWMLGSDVDEPRIGWPACGEIDIVELIGREPGRVHGTVHGPGYSGANGIGGYYDLPKGRQFSDGFHVFAVEWSADAVQFFVDGVRYHVVTRSSLPANTRWVFDHPFFLILNLAVGGLWPGPPDVTTQFPREMVIDYIRVYR
ncbi:MAG: glycoside hydrolase family 16 protein [Acidobacteriota bacterium]|nr:glycoside hydrolase family 16 protein [Acidobacteriota bacterium]